MTSATESGSRPALSTEQSLETDGRPAHHMVALLAGVFTLMLLALGVVGAVAVHTMQADLDALNRDGFMLTQVSTLQRDALTTQLGLERAAITAPGPARSEVIPELENGLRGVLAQWQQTSNLADPEEMAGTAQAIEDWLSAAAVMLGELDRGVEQPDRTELDETFDELMASLGPILPPLEGSVADRAGAAIDRGQLAFAVLAAVAALGLVIGAVVSRTTYRTTHAQHDEIERRHAERAREAATAHAQTRIAQALDFAGSDADVLDAVARALGELLPERPTEMLLADSSRAHFEVGLHTAGEREYGCPVTSPRACPAVAKGQTLVFPDSERFDACAHLRGRPVGAISAVCVPVSISSTAAGVLHSVGRQGHTVDAGTRETLDYIAARAGDRIGALRAFDRSESQAATDPLTGLANRRSFEDRIGAVMRTGTPVTIAFGDIDHFKQLNDTHGHDVGDRALRAFARAVRTAVRPGDVAARWGGEEFVIAFPDTSKDDTVGVLTRLRAAVTELGTTGTTPPFTVSFGVADHADGDDLEALVSAADQALLSAKRAGRDRIELASSVYDLPAPVDH